MAFEFSVVNNGTGFPLLLLVVVVVVVAVAVAPMLSLLVKLLEIHRTTIDQFSTMVR